MAAAETALRENIVFEAKPVASKPLDALIKDLREAVALADRLTLKASGISAKPRGANELRGLFKEATKTVEISMEQMAKVMGRPLEQFRSLAAEIGKKFQRDLKDGVFRNVSSAARFGAELERRHPPAPLLGQGAAAAPAIDLPELQKLTAAMTALTATLSAPRAAAAAAAPAPEAGSAAASPSPGGGTKKSASRKKSGIPGDPDAFNVSRTTTVDAEGAVLGTTLRSVQAGKVLTTVLDDAHDVVKRIEKDIPASSALTRLKDSVADEAKALQGALAKTREGHGALLRQSAANLQALRSSPDFRALDPVSKGRFTRQVNRLSGYYTDRADGAETVPVDRRALAPVHKKIVSATERRAKAEAKLADEAHRELNEGRRVKMAAQAARERMGELLSRGYTQKDKAREDWSRSGKSLTQTAVLTKTAGGRVHTETIVFKTVNGKEAAATITSVNRALAATRAEASAAGRTFLKNLAHVTAWSTGVGALYGSLALARRGFSATVETGYQSARLGFVMNTNTAAARSLAHELLGMSALLGRTGNDALESAVQWARLGLNQQQVAEATRLSLIAANVAELEAIESTEYLQAVMAGYQLRLEQLGPKLGEMNAITNDWNVTNRDLLMGLSRVAPIAQQAGLSFEQTIGIIGATRGRTGQSGTMIGNALKSVIVALSNPELQEKMRLNFNVETRDAFGDIKTMEVLLGELYEKYLAMNNATRQHMAFLVGGKTQGSRFIAMMDSYIRAQVLQINAQLDLNSAENENIEITKTLRSQLQGLGTEFERFASIQGSNGFAQAMSAAATSLRSVLGLMNTGGGSALTTSFLGLMTVLGAKAAFNIKSLEKGVGGVAGKGSFLARSVLDIKTASREMLASLGTAARSFGRPTASGGFFGNLLMDRASAGGIRSVTAWGTALQRRGLALQRAPATGIASGVGTYLGGTALRGAGATAKGLASIAGAARSALGPVVLITGALAAFNKLMEAAGFNSATQEKESERLTAQFERLAAQRTALTTTSNLLDTIGRSLQNLSPRELDEVIKGIKDLKVAGTGPLLESLSGYKAAPSAAGATGVRGEIDSLQRELAAREAQAADEQFALATANRDRVQAELDRLGERRGTGTKDYAAKELELEQARQLVSESFAKKTFYQSQSVKFTAEETALLERQKLLAESIGAILSEAGAAGGPLAAHEAGKEALRAQIEFHDRQKAAATAEKERLNAAETASDGAIERTRAEVEAGRIALTREQAGRAAGSLILPAGLGALADGGNILDAGLGPQKADLARKEQALAELEIASKRRKQPTTTQQALLDQADRAGREAREELDRQNALDPLVQARASARANRDAEGANLRRFAVGGNETEKLLNQIVALRQRDADLTAQIAAQQDAGFRNAELLNRQLVVKAQLQELDLARMRDAADVQAEQLNLATRQRRELERSIMGADTGELLGRAAAMQFVDATKGMDGRQRKAQLFALSPEMRRFVMETPGSPFNPEARELADRARRNPLAGVDANAAALGEHDRGIAGLMKQFRAALPDMDALAASAAAQKELLATTVSLTVSFSRLKGWSDALAQNTPGPGIAYDLPAGRG